MPTAESVPSKSKIILGEKVPQEESLSSQLRESYSNGLDGVP